MFIASFSRRASCIARWAGGAAIGVATLFTASVVSMRPALSESILVINMIPKSLSGETWQDSEPNIAVNPSYPKVVVASAFTKNPACPANFSSLCAKPAPIFVSKDGGFTWLINNIVPSANGMTGDISVAFAQRGGRLYTGILRGGSRLRMLLLRTADPFGTDLMTTLLDKQPIDQPWAEAKTTKNAAGVDVDRPYFGSNDWTKAKLDGTGAFARVDSSLDAATTPPPAGISLTNVDVRVSVRAMPAVRVSAHNDGTAYAIFYGKTGGTSPNHICDVVVVRDDKWPDGSPKFFDLREPAPPAGDGLVGVRVAIKRTVPAFSTTKLGSNRLVASNLSIAVNPRNSSHVVIAWADRVKTTDYSLHVRQSYDRGKTWSSDLVTVTNATNPALAINDGGTLGFLYQKLYDTAPKQRWSTRFLRRTTTGAISTVVLADTPNNNPPFSPVTGWQPYIGDYTDVVVVQKTFYGVFSASNIPDKKNFPRGVKYQRLANFTTKTLFNLDKTAVSVSIDPFFFRIDP